MGTTFNPDNLNSGFNTNGSLNTNLTEIQTALGRLLNVYGDDTYGTNAMQVDIDMNNNQLLNLGTPTLPTHAITKQYADSAYGNAKDWATKVDGIVDATDYSSKAWAIGGTGVTETATRGAAKEWATKAEDSLVDTVGYSSLHWAAKSAASASAAATAETNAETAETNAETAKTNAETAHTAAEVAQAAAEAAVGSVKVSSNDTIASDLITKIVAGDNITLTEVNDGGNETLLIEAARAAISGWNQTAINFVSNDMYDGTDFFDVQPVITGTFASVGPTGSGATNIWADLDVLPADATWIEVRIYNRVRATSATYVVQTLYFRPTGAGTGKTVSTYAARTRSAGASGSHESEAISSQKIALDSSQRFDLAFDNGTDGSIAAQDLELYLVAFG